MGSTMWSVSWAGAIFLQYGLPGTFSKFCFHYTGISESTETHTLPFFVAFFVLCLIPVSHWCLFSTHVCAFFLSVQREAICGNESGKECRALHRDGPGWDKAAEICEYGLCFSPTFTKGLSTIIFQINVQVCVIHYAVPILCSGKEHWPWWSKQRDGGSAVGWL